MPENENILIDARNVNVEYETYHALHDIMLSIKAGELVAIIGPNGCGKSTTMRTINGLLKLSTGSLTVGGLDVTKVSLEEMAKMCSNIPTEFPPDFNLSVYEVVMLGRYPHRQSMWWETEKDEEVVRAALEMYGMSHLADRDITQLSSGERQRTLIAKAYVQQPRIMLVDEPTAHLDAESRFAFLALLERLRCETGKTFLVVMHELPEVLRYAQQVVALAEGTVGFCGTPEAFLAQGLPQKAFGVQVTGDKERGFGVIPLKSAGLEE